VGKLFRLWRAAVNERLVSMRTMIERRLERR
jgi:hypothetical protein